MREFLSKVVGILLKGAAAVYGLAVNIQHSSQVTLGARSKFYKEASVFNLQHDKSKIKIGSDSHIRGELIVFPYGGNIQIGNACYVGKGSNIWSGEKIVIGNHVGISHNVNIIDCGHETDHLERADAVQALLNKGHPETKGNLRAAPIIIEDYVAIYPNSIISRGVRIGEGAIISAGSVVIGDVPPFTLMLGNPARPMKNLKSN